LQNKETITGDIGPKGPAGIYTAMIRLNNDRLIEFSKQCDSERDFLIEVHDYTHGVISLAKSNKVLHIAQLQYNGVPYWQRYFDKK
jgi:hypothetical protein